MSLINIINRQKSTQKFLFFVEQTNNKPSEEYGSRDHPGIGTKHRFIPVIAKHGIIWVATMAFESFLTQLAASHDFTQQTQLMCYLQNHHPLSEVCGLILIKSYSQQIYTKNIAVSPSGDIIQYYTSIGLISKL